MESGKLKTVKQFCNDNAAFNQGGLRSLIFWRGDMLEQAGAIVRLGRKILIDEDKLLGLVRSGALRNVRGVA